MIYLDDLKKIGIYIDLSNVEDSSADLNCIGMAIDYSVLVKDISEGYRLTVLRAYDGVTTTGRSKLQNSLRSSGFEVKLYNTQKFVDDGGKKDWRQKEVDTAITTDVSWDLAMKKVDTAVIVSGDRDMHPAVTRAIEEGCDVRIVALRDSLSDDYLKTLEKYTLLEDYEVFLLSDSSEPILNFVSSYVSVETVADE